MVSRAYLLALEASEGIWEIVVPVSYTHLDVYKRQVVQDNGAAQTPADVASGEDTEKVA